MGVSYLVCCGAIMSLYGFRSRGSYRGTMGSTSTEAHVDLIGGAPVRSIVNCRTPNGPLLTGTPLLSWIFCRASITTNSMVPYYYNIAIV